MNKDLEGENKIVDLENESSILVNKEVEFGNKNDNKNKKRNVIIIILIFFLLIIFAVCAFILLPKSSSNEVDFDNEIKDNNDINDDEKDEPTLEDDENENFPLGNEILLYTDSIVDNKMVKVSLLTGASKLYSTLIDVGDDSVKTVGYDGYYITSKNGINYLKRNKKEVAIIEKNNTIKIYKDGFDSDSMYVAVRCNYNSCYFAEIVGESYAYLYDGSSKNVIYNIYNGNHKFFDNGIVSPVRGIDNAIFIFESSTDNILSTISFADFSLITPDNGTFIAGNSASLGFGDEKWSKSAKYIVVKNNYGTNNAKYGLVDYKMNKQIDFIYDDLNTISDDLLIAKKGDKFGVIDCFNQIVIDFIYDGIQAVDNYYVVIKDGMLGVLNNDGKIVVPLKYSVPKDFPYNLRLCCGAVNSFYVQKKVNQIVIGYYDTTRPLENAIANSYMSYIILDKNGNYSKVNFINKTHNFTDEFYYYDVVASNLNIYTKDRNLYKTLTCSNGMSPDNVNFVNKEVLKYTCGSSKHYYNINAKKEVTEGEVKMPSVIEIKPFYIFVYTFEDGRGVYNRSNELLLKLDKYDTIRHLYSDMYEVMKSDGSVQYYQLKGDL